MIQAHYSKDEGGLRYGIISAVSSGISSLDSSAGAAFHPAHSAHPADSAGSSRSSRTACSARASARPSEQIAVSNDFYYCFDDHIRLI